MADGNSSFERRLRAQLQRRDRLGRFAEMGGGFSFGIKLPSGRPTRVTGKVVGVSGTEDVDVEVKGNRYLQDGVYSVPSSRGETVPAILPQEVVPQAASSRRWSGDVVDLSQVRRVDAADYTSETPQTPEDLESKLGDEVAAPSEEQDSVASRSPDEDVLARLISGGGSTDKDVDFNKKWSDHLAQYNFGDGPGDRPVKLWADFMASLGTRNIDAADDDVFNEMLERGILRPVPEKEGEYYETGIANLLHGIAGFTSGTFASVDSEDEVQKVIERMANTEFSGYGGGYLEESPTMFGSNFAYNAKEFWTDFAKILDNPDLLTNVTDSSLVAGPAGILMRALRVADRLDGKYARVLHFPQPIEDESHPLHYMLNEGQDVLLRPTSWTQRDSEEDLTDLKDGSIFMYGNFGSVPGALGDVLLEVSNPHGVNAQPLPNERDEAEVILSGGRYKVTKVQKKEINGHPYTHITLEDVSREPQEEKAASESESESESESKPSVSYTLPQNNWRADQSDRLISASFSIDEYNDLVKDKVQKLYDKYLPAEKRDAPLHQVVEEVARGMGVQLGILVSSFSIDIPFVASESADEMLATAVGEFVRRSRLAIQGDKSSDAYQGELYTEAFRALEAVLKRKEEGKYAPQAYIDKLRAALAAIEKIRAADPGSQEFQDLKDSAARGVLRALAGIEEELEANPSLRGRFLFSVPRDARASIPDAGAWATMGYWPKSSSFVFSNTYTGHSLIEEHSYIASEPNAMYNGSLTDWTVDVVGDYNQGHQIAVHEVGHVSHYYATVSRYGFELGKDAPTLQDQFAQHGELKNTVAGVLAALRSGLPLSSETSLMGDGNFRLLMNTFENLSDVQKYPIRKDPSLEEAAIVLLNADGSITAGLISYALEVSKQFPFEYALDEIDERVDSPDKARKFIEERLGSDLEIFVKELYTSLSDDLGVSLSGVSTNGLTKEEIFDALAPASIYGATLVQEAVTEARSLLRLVDSLEVKDLTGNEEKIERMRNVLQRILEVSPPAGLKTTSEKTRALLARYETLIEAVNGLDI